MTHSRTSLFRTISAAGIVAAFALAQPAMAEPQDGEAGVVISKGEQRLAEMLEGRVAGEPVNCIRQLPSARMTTIDQTAYVYGSGKTIYVQRTKNPESIDGRDALVSRRFNATQVCRMDPMTTVDPVLGFFTGAVFFEDFIPYTRVEQE